MALKFSEKMLPILAPNQNEQNLGGQKFGYLLKIDFLNNFLQVFIPCNLYKNYSSWKKGQFWHLDESKRDRSKFFGEKWPKNCAADKIWPKNRCFFGKKCPAGKIFWPPLKIIRGDSLTEILLWLRLRSRSRKVPLCRSLVCPPLEPKLLNLYYPSANAAANMAVRPR